MLPYFLALSFLPGSTLGAKWSPSTQRCGRIGQHRPHSTQRRGQALRGVPSVCCQATGARSHSGHAQAQQQHTELGQSEQEVRIAVAQRRTTDRLVATQRTALNRTKQKRHDEIGTYSIELNTKPGPSWRNLSQKVASQRIPSRIPLNCARKDERRQMTLGVKTFPLFNGLLSNS